MLEKLKKEAAATNISKSVEEVVARENDEWKSFNCKFAVIGESGTGKSTLINALRGVRSSSEGAAKVGVIETTLEPKRYLHPNNENIEFWDLPGVGTPSFPKDSYLMNLNIRQYHIFILVLSTRFSENISWLADEITAMGKHMVFVRTKVGIDIDNDKQENQETHNKYQVLTAIREDCRKKLEKKEIKIFLVDSYMINEFDFNDLVSEIITNNNDIIREALSFSLSLKIHVVIDIKKSALEARTLNFALLQLVKTKDGTKELCKKQFEFYKTQFSLDNESLMSLTDQSSRLRFVKEVSWVENHQLSQYRLSALNVHTFFNISKRFSASKEWAIECISRLHEIAVQMVKTYAS